MGSSCVNSPAELILSRRLLSRHEKCSPINPFNPLQKYQPPKRTVLTPWAQKKPEPAVSFLFPTLALSPGPARTKKEPVVSGACPPATSKVDSSWWGWTEKGPRAGLEFSRGDSFYKEFPYEKGTKCVSMGKHRYAVMRPERALFIHGSSFNGGRSANRCFC